jgi:hypothetical protein
MHVEALANTWRVAWIVWHRKKRTAIPRVRYGRSSGIRLCGFTLLARHHHLRVGRGFQR